MVHSCPGFGGRGERFATKGAGIGKRGRTASALAVDLLGEDLIHVARAGSAQPASPTMRAGTPATVLLCGTGASTTEPAATRAQ